MNVPHPPHAALPSSVRRSTFRTLVQPLAIAVLLALVAGRFVRIYAIPSPSMEPTLRAGDRILVTAYVRSRPAAGHVVVFRSPEGERLVKRVIAVPGDLVASDARGVTIGGHPLREPYASDPHQTGVIAPQIVPSGFLFVLGDHRAASRDSRTWGVLPESSVLGRARIVLWSRTAGSTLRLLRVIE